MAILCYLFDSLMSSSLFQL